MQLSVEVGSLIKRPRYLLEQRADDAFRRGEALAFGFDMALANHGIKRTSFIEQAANRVAFSEDFALPDGFELKLLQLEGVSLDGATQDEIAAQIAAKAIKTKFPHLLGHTAGTWFYVPRQFDLPLLVAEPAPQVSPGRNPTATRRTFSLGSANRLSEELQALDTLLSRHGLDADEWLPAALLQAADVSLETGLPVTVTEKRT